MIGIDDFRISDMGPDGNPAFAALAPAVTFRASDDEYLVLWEGDETNGEMEIYAQSLVGGSGVEIGENDIRLSDMGVDGNVLVDAFRPAVASDSGATGYLVVWEGDDVRRGDCLEALPVDLELVVHQYAGVPDSNVLRSFFGGPPGPSGLACAGSVPCPASACPHDGCVEGDPLHPACGACAAEVCAADPACCISGWDATCVGAASICGSCDGLLSASAPDSRTLLIVDDDTGRPTNNEFEIHAHFVPEPGHLVMLGAGIALLLGLERRRSGLERTDRGR